MRWGVGVLLVLVAAVAVAGYAIGAGGPSKDLVLCATKKGGDLSLATAKGKCGKGEKKLTVAKEGPVGPVGPAGAPGAAASPAALAPEAIHYVTGPSTDTCFETPGTFCRASGGDVQWGNLSAVNPNLGNVGYYKDAAGFVHLTGVAYNGSSGGTGGGFIPEGPFYLPAGFRPSVTQVFAVPTVAPGTGTAFNSTGVVEIRPSGLVDTRTPERIFGFDGIIFRP